MALFLFKRACTFLATLAAASLLVFVALELLPGNAAEVQLGPDASPEAVAALVQQWGLDRPAWSRYTDWVHGLATGHMGLSAAYGTPVSQLLAERLALTVPLALMAMALATVLALAVGIFAASHRRSLADAGAMAWTQLGMAIPNFWLAILLVLLFAVQLHWFPAGGFPGWEAGWLPALHALVLPAAALAAVQAAILARITRAAVIEVLQEDFIRTARAKGLSQRAVLWRHGLRNALIPVVTVMGLQFANLLAGTIVVENVFSLPGLGRLIFQSIANRDLAVVRDSVVVLAALVIVVNFLVDLLYGVIDPRLRGR